MKNVAIIGSGVSGKAALAFLESKSLNASIAEKSLPQDCDLVVTSPGVPPSEPLYREAIERGIELIGEFELGARFVKQPCIGVTGTNGKTTLTLLLTHLLNQKGIKAKAVGNIGLPLTEYLLAHHESPEVLVIEMSSFQLETAYTPIFDHVIFLNLTPDHLDRYVDFASYGRAKERIFSLVKEGGKAWVHESLHYDGLPFTGSFPRQLLLELGLSGEDIDRGLQTFQKPEHRLEFVAEIDRVKFINDSKATNVDATLYALSQFQKNVILVAGGRQKGGSFALWDEPIFDKVKKVILFGEAAELIASQLGDKRKIEIEKTLKDAVTKAFSLSQAGDQIVLSPGCASFDQFKNYEDRGMQFKQIVREIIKL